MTMSALTVSLSRRLVIIFAQNQVCNFFSLDRVCRGIIIKLINVAEDSVLSEGGWWEVLLFMMVITCI